MNPEPHVQLIGRIRDALAADSRVDAAWLSGSLARGEGDEFSDVDVTIAVDEADLGACIAEYGGSKSPLGPHLWLKVLFGRVVTAVTTDWDRYDLLFLTPPELRRQDFARLKPLTDGAKPPPGARAPEPRPRTQAERVADAEEFLRVAGLAPVGFGRQEWLVVQDGLAILRKLLIDLMVEANGKSADRGGVKRLNAFLTDDQRATLETLIAPGADRDRLLAAQGELIGLYVPLGRRILGDDWPAAFEAGTRAHLQRVFGDELAWPN
jgi:predicted nucleotidyltransferase